MEKFTANDQVVFGDVNLSEDQIRTIHGEPQNPGQGGWPTLRYFNKETGYGGLMIDPWTMEVAGFGREMTEALKSRLSKEGKKKQIIGQVELYPAIIARKLWKEKLKDRDVIHFIDNDSARCALVKGSSPCIESAWLAQCVWTDESETDCRSWIARALH